MLNRVVEFVAKLVLGKQVAQAVAFVHDSLDGHRSEIVAGLLIILHVLKLSGLVPAEVAGQVEAVLLPILPVVLADRVSKVIKAADGLVPHA